MIARIRARRTERTQGQALVEFAMVIPLFLMLLFGIVDLGRYVYSTNALSQSAREAARAGSVAYWPPDCAGISTRLVCVQTIAKNRSIGVPIDTTDVSVACARLMGDGTFTTCAGTWKADDRMTVTITKDMPFLTPLIGHFLGSAEMSATATVTLG